MTPEHGKPLHFEILVGCTWVPMPPQRIRRGMVFRILDGDGEPYHAAARALPSVDDVGVYVACDHGTEYGVPYEVAPEVVELVAPVRDHGGA